jgi:transposase-like protein
MADHWQSRELRTEAREAAAAPRRQATQAHQQASGAEASQMSAMEVEVEMRARAHACQDQWKEREPQAVAACMHGFEQTVSYLSVHLPLAQVSLMRTTNLRERCHKEIRRTQRDIGMLHSEAGCEVVGYMRAVRETVKQRAACRGKG